VRLARGVKAEFTFHAKTRLNPALLSTIAKATIVNLAYLSGYRVLKKDQNCQKLNVSEPKGYSVCAHQVNLTGIPFPASRIYPGTCTNGNRQT
jgi:hypothetical protein